MYFILILFTVSKFTCGNIFDILDEPKRSTFDKHVNHILKYFITPKRELYLFFLQNESQVYDTDNVIKSLDEGVFLHETTKVYTFYNNSVFLKNNIDLEYKILSIVLILGNRKRIFLEKFVKIRECIILMHFLEELEDLVKEFSVVCVRLFFLNAQGEFLTIQHSEIKHIKNSDYFKQKLNLHRNTIKYNNNWMRGLDLNFKDKIFMEFIESKLNASIKVAPYGDLALLNEIISYKAEYVSYPYKIQRYCFVVHKSGPLLPVQSLMKSGTVWTLLISTVIICSGIFGQNPLGVLVRFFEKFIFNNFRILHARNILETNYFMRISLALLLLPSIVIITAFQAIFFAVIHSPMRGPQINSVNILVNLNYTIYCSHRIECARFKDFDKRLNFNCDLDIDMSIFYNHTIMPKYALLMNCDRAQKYIKSHPFHSYFLHIMDEEHGSYPINLEYKWNIHFKSQIIRLVRSLYENGIFIHIDKSEQYSINFKEFIDLKFESLQIIFNKYEIQGAIFILLFGIFISFFVFLLELLLNKLTKLFL